jgi:hypothetical protein
MTDEERKMNQQELHNYVNKNSEAGSRLPGVPSPEPTRTFDNRGPAKNREGGFSKRSRSSTPFKNVYNDLSNRSFDARPGGQNVFKRNASRILY